MNGLTQHRPGRRFIVSILAAVLLANYYLFGWSRRNDLWTAPADLQISLPDSASKESTTTAGFGETSSKIEDPKVHFSTPVPLEDRQATFLRDLYTQIEEHAPQCPPPNIPGSVAGIGFDAVNAMPRPSLIINTDELQGPMQKAHDGFVAAIKTLTDRPYDNGTRGIVSSAGGEYMPTFVASLRMLRRTGCKLPVEVFVNDRHEYEPYICEVVLPALGAKCKVLGEALDLIHDRNDKPIKVEHYQIKSLAMLLSSFESFLWIDADCFPLHDPEILLDSDPFASRGLVAWPDFWANTASALYFNISRQPELPMTARQSTESGMMLISKRMHFSTLLLAMYYNYYGPDYYWPLLDQGSYGQGDKDTFFQAAGALGADFYTVSEPVVAVEHNYDDWGTNEFSAMAQADPMQDYNLTSQGKWRIKTPSIAEAPRVFFLHASNPKFNAATDLLEKTQRYTGEPGRLWNRPDEVLRRFGYDVEKPYWKEAMTVTCTLEDTFSSWQNMTGLCEDMQHFWNETMSNPDADILHFTDDKPVHHMPIEESRPTDNSRDGASLDYNDFV